LKRNPILKNPDEKSFIEKLINLFRRLRRDDYPK